MMKKSKMLHWWLFAAVTFLTCILLQVPAAWLMAKFYPQQQYLHNIGGNIWSGQADWQQGALRGNLSWQIRPLDVLRLRVAADVQVHSGQSELIGQVGYGLGQKWLVQNMNGQIAPETLAYLAKWQWPSAAIRVQDVHLRFKPKQGFEQANGQLEWAGGDLVYSYAQRQERMSVPPLKAQWSAQQGKLVLAAQDNRQQKMLNLALDQDLMLDVQLTQRLLLNVPSYQGKAGLDTYVMSSRQPLIKGNY